MIYNSIRRRVLTHAALGFFLACATVAGSAQTLQGDSLVRALRHGGYVVVFRHSLTDPTKPDRASIDLNDCRTQRVLTDRGRILARAIGTSFDQMHVPVDKVYGSPLCRTMWTANLAFGHVTVVPGLREPKPKNAANAVKAAAALRPLIGAVPAYDTNTIIVTHGFNIKSITGYIPDEGEAAVFKPGKDGTFQLIGRVKAAQWQALSK
jgi:broad specificity phosphatase PhoE